MTLLGSIKRALNVPLTTIDHEIVHRSLVPTLHRFIAALPRYNLVPKTVIDIGVAYGTPWLYESFAKAKFHLVDPTRESLPYMQAWAEKLHAEIHNIALGAEETMLQIALCDTIIHATLLENIGKPSIAERYTVPVCRFDKRFPIIDRPALCKIDVEGAELSVLNGMGNQIHSLDAIIIETSLISLYHDGPEFSDIIAFMSRHHFSFFDFGGVTRRPYDGALHQIDAIFVPSRSPLRIRRWE